MKKAEIQELLGDWQNLPILTDYFLANPSEAALLLDLAASVQHPENWRAAYLAGKLHDQHPSLIRPLLPRIIQMALKTTHPSQRREFLRILSTNKISETQSAAMLNHCFNLLTSPQEPVAVRVHAMQILFNLSESEPDLKPELIRTIEHEMDLHPTPGLQARGRHLLKKLHQQCTPPLESD